LANILLEEIADVRTVLRGVIKKALHVDHLFGELTKAIRRATEDNLNELEYIEQHGIAALRTIPHGDPLYRKLYTQIVRNISSMKQSYSAE